MRMAENGPEFNRLPGAVGSPRNLLARIQRYCHRGHRTALLSSIDLSLNGGSIACILGASGAGKTTLTRLILGLESGELTGDISYSFGREQLAPFHARRRGLVGSLTAGPPLTPWHRIRKGLDLPNRLNGRLTPLTTESIEPLLTRVGLGADVLDLFPHQLSFGMQQRIGIVSLLAHTPSYLILDEFFTGLDSATAVLVADVLHAYVETSGAVCLLTTHDVDNAIRIGDHRYHLSSQGHVADVTSLPKAGLLKRLEDDLLARVDHTAVSHAANKPI